MSDEAERERARYEALSALVDNYRLERDDAREQLYFTKAELGRWVDRETKAVRERDEARAEVGRLRYDFTNRDRMWAEECLRGVSLERRLQEARAEVEKLSESAKAAWEAECVMRDQRDRYHAEWKQERQEVERLRAEAASFLAMARIADAKHDQKCAEVDMLRGVGCMEDDDGPCGACRKCAYRRGAEAMREACARWMSEREGIAKWVYDDALSALPIPEEP